MSLKFEWRVFYKYFNLSDLILKKTNSDISSLQSSTSIYLKLNACVELSEIFSKYETKESNYNP